MLKLGWFGAIALILGFSQISFARDTIYIQPGTCVRVGKQEVCATQNSTATSAVEPQILYTCRFGAHPGADVPDLKSYALFQISISPEGRKVETLLKNFGTNGKAQCEKEAEKKSAK